MLRSSLIVSFVMLAACGGDAGKRPVTALDERIEGRGQMDPALARAIEGPIMIDMALADGANAHSLMPAPAPASVRIPAIGEADEPMPDAPPLPLLARAACTSRLTYSAGWALRLPPDLPLPPRAQLLATAGSDAANCRLRIVRIAVPGDAALVADHYRAAARRAGYAVATAKAAEVETLRGTRADGASFAVSLRPGKRATVTDIVVDGGG